MRKFAAIISALILLGACTTKSKYHLYSAELDIELLDITPGYIYARFYSTEVTYYVTGCMKVNDQYDPVGKPRQFMTLMVDSLYQDYLRWRYDYLKDQEDYIADFASHSLQYGESEKYFQNLEPCTNYWIYAFVVDPDKKEPSTDVIWMETVTTDSLAIHRAYFDTRIQGTYFYMYPRSEENGPILEDVPYTGVVVDSASVADIYPPKTPDSFMASLDRYLDMTYISAVELKTLPSITYTGVKQVNYSGRWEHGKVYYILTGEIQGGIVNRAFFRFVYDTTKRTQDVALVRRDPYWSTPRED